MAVNFANGTNSTVISRPPRVIHTPDNVAGCPPARAAWAQMCATNVTTTRPAWFYVQGRMIRAFSGRTDLYLVASGPNGWSSTNLRVRLNFTNGGQWDHVHLRFNTYQSAIGTYTFWLAGPGANAWGCTSQWGTLSVMVQEV